MCVCLKMLKMFLLYYTVLIAIVVNANDGYKLIIDNDAGGDDAIAIFTALLYEKHFQGPQLIALTTVNGNANEDNVYINNQKILNVAMRRDIPIYRGSKESLVITPYSSHYYGEDGLGNNGQNLIDPVPAEIEGAVLTLIELAKKHPGKINLVTIGTLTNVALALKLDPEFIGRLNHLFVGGGHIYNEKYPNIEFNVKMDAEAYRVIVQHATPEKVTILPFSQVKEFLNISLDWRRNTLGGLDTDVMRAQNVFEREALGKKLGWDSLDPATVALALSNIPTGENRGLNTNTFVEKKDANVRVAYSFDMEKYMTFLMDVFSADIKKSK